MRAGGVLAGGDDREVHSMVALGQDAPRQLGRHIGLGATDQRDRTGLQGGRDAIDRGGGGPQRVHLVGILHGAQRTDHIARVAELGGRESPQ